MMPKLGGNDAAKPEACNPAQFLALTLRNKRAVTSYSVRIEITGPR